MKISKETIKNYLKDEFFDEKEYDNLMDYYGWQGDLILTELDQDDLVDLCKHFDIDLYRVYNGSTYLQLHDDHTFWKIKKDIEPAEYSIMLDHKIKQFNDAATTELYLLGRSGRHVSVDINYKNILQYNELKKLALKLETELINEINEVN